MPFEKGDPRINRNGRPKKGTCYTDLLKQELTKEEFVKKVKELFQSGNESIVKHVWDRFEGRVPDKHEITGEEGEDLNINVKITKIGNQS